MDLKDIKAMPRNFTATKFKNLVLQSGIVKPSQEFASTADHFKVNQFKNKNLNDGYRAEVAVIRLLRQRNWVLECQRVRTTIAEIDLIFSKGHDVMLIEVKRLDDPWRAFERIGHLQVQALKKNLFFLSVNLKMYSFCAAVCWVDDQNRVSFVRI